MAGWLLRSLLLLGLIVFGAGAALAVYGREYLPPTWRPEIAKLVGELEPVSVPPGRMPAIGRSPELAEGEWQSPGDRAAPPPGSRPGDRFVARFKAPGQQVDEPVPLEFEVVGHDIGPDGRPRQTLRVSFKPGATFSYLALALFDDELRIDDLFQQARRQLPGLRSPAAINFGTVFDVNIDPTTTFVIAESKQDAGTKLRRYSNGVVERLYPPQAGVLRIVDFPTYPRVQSFDWPTEDGIVSVPAQARFVDYQHRAEVDVRRVIEQVYGVYGLRAVFDFSQQTKWHPVDQPLKEGNWYRLIFTTARPFADVPPPIVELASPDPAVAARLREQAEARARVGIYLIGRGETHDTFLIRVDDPAVRADVISRQLYGSQDRIEEIARLASIPVPERRTGPEAVPAAPFNPSLFGKSFIVSVDQADEAFPYRTETAGDRRIVTLLDGVVLNEPFTDVAGGSRFVNYPSGYRKITYRPPTVTTMVLDYLSFLPQLPDYLADLGRADLAQRDRKIAERAAKRDQLLPQLLWAWDLGISQRFGDVARDVRYVETPSGRVLEALLLPRDQVTTAQAVIHVRIYVKLAVVALLLGVATALFVGASLMAGERTVADRLAEAAGRPREIRL